MAVPTQETPIMIDMFLSVLAEEAHGRRRQMLRTAFGPVIAAALADPSVLEVMVNPDGKLWIDRAALGRADTGEIVGATEAERIIRLVAAHVRREITDRDPIVSAELPETGERFEGILPPVAPAPCFSIRKPAELLFTLSDYVTAGITSAIQADALAKAIRDRRNILVVGGTSSGKTTLVNALLAEIARLDDRVVILEDTRELRCAAKDVVTLRTKPGVASLADLVRSTLRLRPDRIVVGEVRGPEALDMLKAWNTGHPGGITTLHANSALLALYRLEQLIQEAVVTVPRDLIVTTIEVIAFLDGRGDKRKVTGVFELDGLDDDGDYALKPLDRPALRTVM
jgi:type IV secretion system protein TrbB